MGRRILIVEDSQTQAERIQLLLEDEGHRVELARDGREGLARARCIAPDLVITDVLMPEMDGFALCRALKSAEATRSIPVVLLTGQRTPMDIVRGLEGGADNFITKPFEDEHLLDRVRRIFENMAHREKGGLEMEVSVRVAGRQIVVNADKQQMIELLFSTSEELSESNKQLDEARLQMEEQARDLERKIDARTRELREAEEKYRALVEQMPAVVYIAEYGRIGRTLYISPQIEALLGFPPAEWLADPGLWTRQTHPGDRERVDAEFEHLRESGVPTRSEYRMLARDGHAVWVRDEARVVRRSEGGGPRVQGIIVDVSDKKRAEAVQSALYRIGDAARSAEDMDAFYAALHGIVGELTYARNFYIALHDEASDTLSFPYFVDEVDTVPPSMKPGKSLTARVLRTGRSLLATPEVFAELVERGDVAFIGGGSVDWLGIPLNKGDRCFGVLAVQSYREDVRFTEADKDLLTYVANHVAAAVDRKRAIESIVESEMLKKGILDAALDCIVAMDAGGRITEFNAAAEKTFGFRRQDVIGRLLADLLIPPPLRERHRRGLARYLATGEASVVGKRIEMTAVRADGTEFPVRMEISTTRVRGNPIFTGCLRDITELKRSEEELRVQREALYQREKVAAMGTLLAGVAHELNNPLAVVIGQSNLLRRAAGEGPLAVRADKIVQAAERCVRIVGNFLALARQRPPERRRVSLNEVVQEAVELLAYPLRVEDVELGLELGAGLPALWADPHQLHQVVVNLVTNAHHALRGGPPPRRVSLATRLEHGRVVLEVADTGPGIPPETLPRIFDPFFTTKPPSQGTGLGLSLCLGIVENHGGSLRVASGPGKGTAFRVELPVEAPPLEPEGSGAGVEARPVESKAILVVDDEKEVAEMLTDVLSADGHRVDTAPDGAVALEMLARSSYDLIISDVKMPVLDGPGLYREIERRHPQLARRFIFLSGDTLSPDTDDFLGHSGRVAVEKPVSLDNLRRSVRRVLAGS